MLTNNKENEPEKRLGISQKDNNITHTSKTRRKKGRQGGREGRVSRVLQERTARAVRHFSGYR